VTDNEYVKKAVELAGWQTTRLGNQRVKVFVPWEEGIVKDIGYIDYPHVLDALAAQLVRQVDAISGIDITIHQTFVDLEQCADGHWFSIAIPESEDRTMNTIKAIVDSGVLGNAGEQNA